MIILKNLRKKIDILDEKILDLLYKRISYVFAIGKLKKRKIYIKTREEEIIKRLKKINKEKYKNVFPSKGINIIFKKIITYCRILEKNEK
jgi:chorismate mutase